jgi:hypothetical protein
MLSISKGFHGPTVPLSLEKKSQLIIKTKWFLSPEFENLVNITNDATFMLAQ